SREVSVIGLAEVVRHLPRIYSRFRHLLRQVDSWKPDAAVLIDFPDFNFRLARALHQRGIPVIYYISPQLWAWRSRRIELVRRYIHKMLVIFPFEQEWYRQRGVEAEFVGHPLCDVPVPAITRGEFAQAHDIDPGKIWISLLPGSRRQEFARIAPALIQAAQILEAQEQGSPDFEFLLPVASTLSREWVRSFVPEGLRVTLTSDARETLHHSRAAAVASGTATVQTALAGVPFLMVYRVSPLTWSLGRRLVKVPHYAMPNLIAGERVVPELVQEKLTPQAVCAALRNLLAEGRERQQMIARLQDVRTRLCGCGTTVSGREPVSDHAIDRAATALLAALK
ncbi:MAG: lipid-A-disaccharide synthase, partial [Candidatus Korobacteraceae bacterium]